MLEHFMLEHPYWSAAIPAVLGAIGFTGLLLEWFREE